MKTVFFHDPNSVVSPKPMYNCGEISCVIAGKGLVRFFPLVYLLVVTLCGWVSSVRKLGKDLSFISLRDGKGTTQIRVHHDRECKFSSLFIFV
jgi:hypothetical protein